MKLLCVPNVMDIPREDAVKESWDPDVKSLLEEVPPGTPEDKRLCSMFILKNILSQFTFRYLPPGNRMVVLIALSVFCLSAF